MKLSIIIPVYNVSEYVVECLDSIAIQGDVDAECIIVDDCGTDDSMSKVSAWIDSYKGSVDFKIIHHDHNKGISEARNTGMRHMTGDYVLFLDSDDYLLPNAISSLVEVVEKHPDVDYVVSSCECCRNDLVNRWQISDNDKGYWSNQTDIQRIVVKNPNVWNKLYKCSLLKENGFEFDESLFMIEDLVFNFQVVHKILSICCIQNHTYFYRIRQNSLMTSANRDDEKLKNHVNVYSRLMLQEVDSKYNYLRFDIIRGMRYLLYARKNNSNLTAWKEFDSLVRRFLLLELRHFRLRNAFVLFIMMFPIYKMLR